MADPVFFKPTQVLTVARVCELTSAKLSNPAYEGVEILGLASAMHGGDGMLVFVDGRKNIGLLNGLRAAAVLCQEELLGKVPAGIAALVTPRPSLAFTQVARVLFPDAFFPEPLLGERGISKLAAISPDSAIEDGATVEAGAIVGAGAAIGSGTIISPSAVVGPGCQIGRNCFVGPNVSITNALIGDRVVIHAGVRIGQAGFGYVGGPKGPESMPQIGRVVIQDSVEIGANTTIDRGALEDTVIGEGTKIDNLVQIAHNVRIGRGCLIAAQCGLSGSVVLGDYVMLGGRVGIADHVEIGSNSQIAAASGIMTNVPSGERWGGMPAQPIRNFFREIAAIRKLSAGASDKGDDNG